MSGSLIDRVRVVIARVAESHTAFASVVGISKDKLSKSLAGSRRFTSLELALIAEAGGVTVDWLLTGKTPARPSMAARGATLDAPSVADSVDRYMAAFDVLDLVGQLSRAPALPMSPGWLPPAEQGEALAQQASLLACAEGFDIAQLGMAGLASMAEHLFGIDVAIGRLPEGLDGLAWQRDGRRLILLSRTRQWTRQRFTFAHELGHILAVDAQEILVDRRLAPGLEQHPSEIRANSFAAAFLMSADDLRHRVDGDMDRHAFARLVVDFKVSPSAMAVRLRSLGLLRGPRSDDLKRMTSPECHEMAGSLEAYVERVNESSSARLPSQLVSALFTIYREGNTTLRPLANLLDADVDDLHEALHAPTEAASGDLVYSL